MDRETGEWLQKMAQLCSYTAGWIRMFGKRSSSPCSGQVGCRKTVERVHQGRQGSQSSNQGGALDAGLQRAKATEAAETGSVDIVAIAIDCSGKFYRLY